MVQQLATNTFGTAKWIVSPTASDGTHTTIQGAIDDASSGDVIFIREGTYTENLSIDKNLQFIAYGPKQRNAPNFPILKGKMDLNSTTGVKFVKFMFETNGDSIVNMNAVSQNLVFEDCRIKGESGITSIVNTSGSNLYINNCSANIGSGAKFLDQQAGVTFIFNSFLECASSTASTISAGSIQINHSNFACSLTTSGAAFAQYNSSSVSATNQVCLTQGSSSTNGYFRNCTITSGTATAVDIDSGTQQIYNCVINSSNTNAIDGAGTIKYGGLTFSGSSSHINTTTKTLVNEGPSRVIGSSNTGATNDLTIKNTDNTNTSSHASLTLQPGGTSGGDPFIRWNVPSGQDYSMGIDNSDSDKLTITDDADPSTGNVIWEISSAGERTMPLQPAFLAQHSVDQDNVTGNGTTVTVNFTTEVFDQNSDYDGTNTFTAPVAGRYCFFTSFLMDQLNSGTVGIVNMVASNRTIQLRNADFNSMAQSGGSGSLTINGYVFVDMDAADTIKVQAVVTGIGADTADIPASSISHFGGHLVC